MRGEYLAIAAQRNVGTAGPFRSSIARTGRTGIRVFMTGFLACWMTWAGGAEDLQVAREHLLNGRYLDAVSAAEQAVRDSEDREVWLLILGEGLLQIGRYPEASAVLTNALAIAPRNIRLHWLAQEVFQRHGQTEAARRAIQEILDLVAARPVAYRDPADLVVFGRAALRRGADPRQVLDRVFAAAKRADNPVREAWLAAGELALEKRDFALAARNFQEGLQRFPNDPDLHLGLARAHAPDDTALMVAALERALACNSNHLGSLLLLAEYHVDREDYAGAEALYERVRRVDPHRFEAWAGHALVAHLNQQPARAQAAREMALRFWTNNPHVDHFIGRKLSQKYRFAEGAAAQRRALEFDPEFLPARAQLAMDLLRLGDEAEGWRLAQEVHERDPYDVAVHNLMTLRDVTADFVMLTNEHFVLRMSPREAALYGARALALLERARERLTARYGAVLSRPVLVEIFPEQRDFAVRTFGLPENHGFLGVCFGHVITANSPTARPGQRFNWESMLWHEFAHVITLQITRNRLPRWLSEGISVYEERQAHPAWGQRMTPAYRDMILGGELTPVSKLSGAFIAPPSGHHLQFAYYQSSLVVEFLVTRFGAEKLTAILRNLSDGQPVNEAIEAHTVPMPVFEQEFAAFARRTAEALAPSLDWEKPLPALSAGRGTAAAWQDWTATRPDNYWVLTRQAAEFINARRWTEARVVLERLVAAYPDDTGPDSAWRQLATVCRALDDAAAERAAWSRLAERDDEAADAYLRLCELAAAAGDWDAVRLNAERYLAVDPLVPAPYRFLARAAEATGDAAGGVAACRALLALEPANPAEVHFQLARHLHQLGDRSGARRHLLRALEDAPRHRAALRWLRALHTEGSVSSTAAASLPTVP